MMSTRRGIFAAVLCTAVSAQWSVAQAAPVELSASASQTVAGQDFTFSFTGLAASDGTGGTFVLAARGDYAGGTGETLSWSMDGGTFAGGPVGGYTPAYTCDGTGVGGPFDSCTTFGSDDILWQRTYSISASVLNALLADAAISLFVDLDSAVNRIGPASGVEVSIRYESPMAAVPVAGTLALLGLGLAAAGTARRRDRVDC